jgi:aryl-alcohol dehydrogenase-like predicted oxidoreductase
VPTPSRFRENRQRGGKISGVIAKRALGATGIDVGEIGLGAWQLGNTDQWSGPDHETSLRIVDEALRLGINLFDTAPGYASGRGERLLGEALDGRRNHAVIVSKFGHKADGTSDWDAGSIAPAVERTLTALRTDYLDVILMHSPPRDLLDGRSAHHYKEFERLRQAGMVRAYGASVDWAADIDLVVDTTGSQVVEVLLNVFHQEPLRALEKAAEKGVGAIVKVPLDSGWLGGGYDKFSRFSGVRSRWTRADIERRAALVEKLKAIIPDDEPMARTALRWLLAQRCVSSVIPGATSPNQLRENVTASRARLPAEVVEAIGRLWATEIAPDPLPW